jgi:multiple sugar transport system ATP-binding protein
MVFQHHALYPHLSVFENIAFGLRVRHCPRPEIQRRVAEAVSALGLEDCAARLPREISGGQRQRAALGRAMVRRPKLFLFDEPLSNLDGPMRAQMRVELVRLQARLAATAIYVTHDQCEAMLLGHRIAVIKQGVLQQVAPPLELYRQPVNRFVAAFFGLPPMNFLSGILVAKGDALHFLGQTESGGGPSGLTLRLEPAMAAGMADRAGKPIILGIRPEHISAASSTSVSEPRIEATIERVQPMGGETCLNLVVGANWIVARLPTANGASTSYGRSFVFDMSQAHFFDPATEKRVGAD